MVASVDGAVALAIYVPVAFIDTQVLSNSEPGLVVMTFVHTYLLQRLRHSRTSGLSGGT